jgi:hypothetical protein
MTRLGFEPTITVFERAKTVRALDHAATVIGRNLVYSPSIALVELRMSWAGHIAHMELSNTHQIFLG